VALPDNQRPRFGLVSQLSERLTFQIFKAKSEDRRKLLSTLKLTSRRSLHQSMRFENYYFRSERYNKFVERRQTQNSFIQAIEQLIDKFKIPKDSQRRKMMIGILRKYFLKVENIHGSASSIYEIDDRFNNLSTFVIVPKQTMAQELLFVPYSNIMIRQYTATKLLKAWFKLYLPCRNLNEEIKEEIKLALNELFLQAWFLPNKQDKYRHEQVIRLPLHYLLRWLQAVDVRLHNFAHYSDVNKTSPQHKSGIGVKIILDIQNKSTEKVQD
jgi:hypothetical protein